MVQAGTRRPETIAPGGFGVAPVILPAPALREPQPPLPWGLVRPTRRAPRPAHLVPGSVDLAAVGRGTAVAVAVSLPVSLLGLVVVDDGDDPGVVFALLLLVLAGLGAGGYVAARQVPSAPLLHGTVAALAAFALIQGVGLVRRVATGAPFSLPSIAFAAFMACCCGLLGGVVAARRRRP